MQNTYENRKKRELLNNQSETKIKQSICSGFNKNNITTKTVFKISKPYSKTVKIQRDRNVNQNFKKHFPTKNSNTTIPNQSKDTINLSNYNKGMNRIKKQKQN